MNIARKSSRYGFLVLIAALVLTLSGCNLTVFGVSIETAQPTAAPLISDDPTSAPTQPPASETQGPVTLDFAAVAENLLTETVPAVPQSENAFWTTVMPQHTRLTLQGYAVASPTYQPQIFIYPAADLAPANEIAGKMAADLQAVLQTQQSGDELPFLPLMNAKQTANAQVQYLEFKNGKGVRFLTQFNQGPVPVNNTGLIYTFQGLTSDGKYYIAVVLPVTHPELPDTADVNEELVDDFQGYLAKTATLLNEQPAETFTPDLTKLDALIRSIEVK